MMTWLIFTSFLGSADVPRVRVYSVPMSYSTCRSVYRRVVPWGARHAFAVCLPHRLPDWELVKATQRRRAPSKVKL